MRQQLADIRDRGEALAVLWASESGIYGRYGYGRASWHDTFTIRRGEGALAPDVPADPGLRLRLTEPEQARAELAKVYDTVLETRPGFFARNDLWWDRLLYDPATDRQDASPLRCLLAEDDAGPRGYALYSGTGGGTTTCSCRTASSTSGSWSPPTPPPARRCGATCSAGT